MCVKTLIGQISTATRGPQGAAESEIDPHRPEGAAESEIDPHRPVTNA